MTICKSDLAKRPLLYTDSIGGAQVCRDDIWAVTTEELNDTNERIRELEAELITARRTINEYAGYFATEREVSDKLEKALEFYANGGHSVYLYGVLVDWKAERSRLEASGFSCVGEGYNGGETYMEDGTTASSALAEVKDLRNANPAIQLDKTKQEAKANGHISEYY